MGKAYEPTTPNPATKPDEVLAFSAPRAPSFDDVPLIEEPETDVVGPAPAPAPTPSAAKPQILASLDAELEARAKRLREQDGVGAARAYLELGIVRERLAADRQGALRAYESARSLARAFQPALLRLRRLLWATGEGAHARLIETIDDELGVSESSQSKADLYAEKARAHRARGRLADATESYGKALALVPSHAAALRGLESTLRRAIAVQADPPLVARLADHLGRAALAYVPSADHKDGDIHLAAWLQVERAAILDKLLGKPAEARDALEQAVALEPAPGPVRASLTRHLIRHKDMPGLASSLAAEAGLEQDDDRASRLLYTAARIAIDQNARPTDSAGSPVLEATQLLWAAVKRAPRHTATAARALDELIRLFEAAGESESSVAAREKRLESLAAAANTPAEALVHEHLRLSMLETKLGRIDRAAGHAERALALDPENSQVRETLDRLLVQLGRHESRVRLWVAEANAPRPTATRVRALLRAADITFGAMRRREEAMAHLRAAWVIEPGDETVFDALSALLAPPTRDPDQDLRGVRERLELYALAAGAAHDSARKVALLEKLASIWEDELGQPARALDEIEKVLTLEPNRRTTILAMARNATRAGDFTKLVQALTREAELAAAPKEKVRIFLRAASVLTEQSRDLPRALAMLDRALAVDPNDGGTLAGRFEVLEAMGRHDEARAVLSALILREKVDSRRFELLVQAGLLDETRLNRANDAVLAYQAAAQISPHHPLPAREIARLLRSQGEPRKLVDALTRLATSASDARSFERYLFQAAEVHEFLLGDDKSALAALSQAEAVPDALSDTALLEAIERIHIRANSATDLAALYPRWIATQPPPHVDNMLRLALAELLTEASPKDAIVLLDGVVSVMPSHVPALRMLERIHRGLFAFGALCSVLRAEAAVFESRLARAGALWELVTNENAVDDSSVLDALTRISAEELSDPAALDATIGVASKILADPDVPHSLALLARARLAPAIRARRALESDALARAAFEIEEAVLADRESDGDAVAAGVALAGYKAALTDWPESLVAARGVERLAEQRGDREALILSQVALSRLVHGLAERGEHLVRAANLTLEGRSPTARTEAIAHYEEALRVHPDCVSAGRALSVMLATDVPRLVDQLGAALERATEREAVLLLGTAVARGALTTHHAREARPKNGPLLAGAAASPEIIGPSPVVGVTAMRKVMAKAPDDVPSLLLAAELLVAAKTWAEARDVLLHAVAVARENDVPAHVSANLLLADLYEIRLDNLPRAQEALEAVLARVPTHRDALSTLHRVATGLGNNALAIQSLRRLADVSPDATTRVDVDLRLADACRVAGDADGRVRALADAIASSPNDPRPAAQLTRLFRTDTDEGATRYAEALALVLEIAAARRLPVDPRWLTTLGMFQVTVLQRPQEGLAHLRQASVLPNASPDIKVALGRGLEAANRNMDAVHVFREVMTSDAESFGRITELTAGLASLEAALSKEGRVEERLAVEEVRACLGEIPPDRMARIRARRFSDGTPYAGALAGAEIAHILVSEARSPILQASLALAPLAAKILRFELSALGVTSRERLGSRDGHPTRLLAERLAKVFGIEAFELYLSPSWQGALRVYPGDPPAIVGSTGFAELPEPEQAFSLARLLTRVAIGPTWLDEVPLEAFDALLVAALRVVQPEFGAGTGTPAREAMVQSYVPAVQKVIGRRQRRQLEEMVPSLSANFDPRTLAIGVRRSEYRAAYAVSGNLVAAIDYLRRFDREVGRSVDDPRVLLQHPVTNELLRYALSAEGFAERQRLGTAAA